MPFPERESDIQTLAEAGIEIDTLVSAAADFIRRQSVAHSQTLQTPLNQEEQEILRLGGVPDSAFLSSDRDISPVVAAEYGSLVAQALKPVSVAERLGISMEEVLQKVSASALYAIDTPEGWVFPQWQFHGTGTLPGLQILLKAIPSATHSIGIQRFFSSPHVDLAVDTGREVIQLTPRQWIISGRSLDDVLILVKDL